MKEKKYLVTVTNDDIKKLKVKNVNFLFPLQDLCVGYSNTYKITQIDKGNSFIFVNRILDKSGIKILENTLKDISSKIIGICFTDLGVIEVVKRLNLNIKLIYMQNHNTTNVRSINYYLEIVDSLLISTDITKNEIINILDKTNKPLIIPFFMLVDVMYSRRKLLSNFSSKFDLPKKNEIVLKEPISNQEFLAIENEYGTMIFIDYRELNHENILYYYINPIGLNNDDVLKILNDENIEQMTTLGFLNNKTYYNLKEVSK